MSIASTGLSRGERVGGTLGARSGFIPDPLAISIRETVRITSLCRATIYVLLQRKTLRAVKVGGRTCIDYQSVKELMRTGAEL